MTMRKILPFLLILSLSSLAACKQELPRQLEQPNVFGTVQEVKQVAEEKQLIYVQGSDSYFSICCRRTALISSGRMPIMGFLFF